MRLINKLLIKYRKPKPQIYSVGTMLGKNKYYK